MRAAGGVGDGAAQSAPTCATRRNVPMNGTRNLVAIDPNSLPHKLLRFNLHAARRIEQVEQKGGSIYARACT